MWEATLNNDEKEDQNKLHILVQGESKVSIPVSQEMGSGNLMLTDAKGKKVKFKKSGEMIRIDVDGELNGKWLSLTWN